MCFVCGCVVDSGTNQYVRTRVICLLADELQEAQILF